MSANYTFSRNYGNVETVTGWLESGAGNPAAGYQTNNLANEFALSSFDVPHRFVFNYVLELPFGAGKKYGAGATGFQGALNQRVDAERLHHVAGRISSRIYGNP